MILTPEMCHNVNNQTSRQFTHQSFFSLLKLNTYRTQINHTSLGLNERRFWIFNHPGALKYWLLSFVRYCIVIIDICAALAYRCMSVILIANMRNEVHLQPRKGIGCPKACVYGGMGLLPYNLDRMGLDEEDYNNQNALNGSQVCGVLCVCMCVGIERYVRQRRVTDTDTHGRREGPSIMEQNE